MLSLKSIEEGYGDVDFIIIVLNEIHSLSNASLQII